MKINQTQGAAGMYQQNRVRRTQGADSSVRVSKGDGVVLSKEAQEALAMRDKVNQSPGVRTERVDDLRRQIQSGTYGPSGHEIADKLLKARVFDDLV